MNEVKVEKIDCIIGKIIEKIDANESNDVMKFVFQDNSSIEFYHDQDCCEDVHIEDVCGDLDDLLNTPLLVAESSTKDEDNGDTWTFYIFSTIKGTINVRWLGYDSYYSLDVEWCYTNVDGIKKYS
jgi:hypothetical protein